MKKIIAGAAAAAALISAATAFAEGPTINFNGEQMTFDVDPYITETGNTMIPFRAIFEAADADVMWDDEMKTVIAVKGSGEDSTSIVLQIGKNEAFVNDRKVELEAAAEITGDRTFVPLRFVMESLGAKVDWDGDTYTVSIITE
ncbi:MAG: copper amine oxidase N-terminal domain-containing protein [Candidatus Ornithomonoglobus sp.]